MQGIKINDKIINLGKVVFVELSSNWIRFYYEKDERTSYLIAFENKEEAKQILTKIEEMCCNKNVY